MKITKRHLRKIIREQVTSPDLSPHLGIVIQQLDDFTVSELYTLAKSATEAWRAKQKEAKTDLNIQEMARPKLKYNVKVERLADTLMVLRVDYLENEMATNPDYDRSKRWDDPVFSSFFPAEDALSKLAKTLAEAEK